MLNLEEGMDKQQMSLHSYDVVISVNALHRNIDAADAVKKVAELLKPNGILLMTDLVVRTYLQELTAAFFGKWFCGYSGRREKKQGWLPRTACCGENVYQRQDWAKTVL